MWLPFPHLPQAVDYHSLGCHGLQAVALLEKERDIGKSLWRKEGVGGPGVAMVKE